MQMYEYTYCIRTGKEENSSNYMEFNGSFIWARSIVFTQKFLKIFRNNWNNVPLVCPLAHVSFSHNKFKWHQINLDLIEIVHLLLVFVFFLLLLTTVMSMNISRKAVNEKNYEHHPMFWLMSVNSRRIHFWNIVLRNHFFESALMTNFSFQNIFSFRYKYILLLL